MRKVRLVRGEYLGTGGDQREKRTGGREGPSGSGVDGGATGDVQRWNTGGDALKAAVVAIGAAVVVISGPSVKVVVTLISSGGEDL